MPSHEFFFALEVSSQGAPVALVEELAVQVFRHVGCPTDSVRRLTTAFEQAVAKSAAGRQPRCDVQFRAHDGKLDVLVSLNGGRVWQDTQTIP